MKIIKKLLILTILTVASCSHFNTNKNIAEEQEKQYVMGTDDIPLFADLELIEQDSSNFDTVSGNIVISKYFGKYKNKDVKDFYLKSLPQLGWNLVANKTDLISFKREEDKLEIKFNYSGKNLYVRFFISSAV